MVILLQQRETIDQQPEVDPIVGRVQVCRRISTTLLELRLQLLGEINALARRRAQHHRSIDQRKHSGHADAEEGNGSLSAGDLHVELHLLLPC